MNHPYASVTYAAIKQLLLNRLQAALGLYVPDASVLKQQNRHISLHRAKDNPRVLYVCAIALQLSGVKNIPPLEIANAIATLVRQLESRTEAHPTCNFTVQVVPPGWIHLELTEPAIAAWLQRLSSPPNPQRGPRQLSRRHRETPHNGARVPPAHLPFCPSSSRLFAVQYAHARCCSLVQMAHREGLITLTEPDHRDGEAIFCVVAPDPIPWLTLDQKLRFCHPAERAMIAQVLGLLDDLYCPSPSRQPIDWEKAAFNLSQAFQAFYSCCRIWGEVKVQTIHLAQARLGLVMATQQVLRLLLQQLGVSAPLEL